LPRIRDAHLDSDADCPDVVCNGAAMTSGKLVTVWSSAALVE